ncbi:MAG TPA: MFS transporter [Vicinamibacterales bacterium]|nr:MFS transporter [Vicinamibacterales bacterium]
MRPWPSSIISLQHRNFRLLWIGLLLSFSGSMMQNAALLWHVSLLVSPDRKAIALGVVGLVRVAPVVVFSMVSGVVADAMDRKRVLLITQSLAGCVALALAVLTWRGSTALWPIYALSAAGAAVGAFDLPARQALIPALVPREHLPNAINLNSLLFQTASVLGPAMAGLVIAEAGVAAAYLFNALSFGFVILALVLMRNIPDRPPAVKGDNNDLSMAAAMEGLRFVFRSPLIRSTMLLDFFATFFASATALLPIFAQDILGVGARGYGWLFAAPAVGSFITSIALVPWTQHIRRRGSVIIWSVLGHGVATIVFGLSRTFWLTFACLALVGATDTVSTVLRNIIRQLETPDRLRGRMTGINMMFFVGGPQLGELEAGAVASGFGAPLSVISGGIGCLIATAWVAAATPRLRTYRATESAPARA